MTSDNRWAWAIGGASLLVLGVMAAIVTLYAMAPAVDHMPLVTTLIGLTSTAVLAMLALLKTLDNSRELADNTKRTDATATAVGELANGAMDAKIRAAVADVLPDSSLDPEAKTMLRADRERRAALAAWVERELKDRLEGGA